jgi:hypothetical protein
MRTGRQTKLTPQVQHQICTAVALGLTPTSAGAYLGLSKSVVLEWLQRGRNDHPRRGQTRLYADFVEAIEKARAQDELRRLARLEHAAKGGQVVYEKVVTYPDGRIQTERKVSEPQWTADAWVLERTRPDQYGRRDRLHVQVQIERIAERIAAEVGLTSTEVLQEAQRLLEEYDRDLS